VNFRQKFGRRKPGMCKFFCWIPPEFRRNSAEFPEYQYRVPAL
jgi:hypothetical protein